jgi:hypothetical protein
MDVKKNFSLVLTIWLCCIHRVCTDYQIWSSMERCLRVNGDSIVCQTRRSDTDTIKDYHDNLRGQAVYRQMYNETKILFLKISDHQQSVAPAPSRGLLHTYSSAGGR